MKTTNEENVANFIEYMDLQFMVKNESNKFEIALTSIALLLKISDNEHNNYINKEIMNVVAEINALYDNSDTHKHKIKHLSEEVMKSNNLSMLNPETHDALAKILEDTK
jgi:uncharacterized coiled-coil DUF342 family protein